MSLGGTSRPWGRCWLAAVLGALMVSAALGLIGRPTSSPATDDGVLRAVSARVSPCALADLADPRGRLAAPSRAPQTSSSEAAPPATLSETLEQAEKAEQQGRLDEALKKCREALALDPKSAHAYYLLGVVEVEVGATEEAKQALLHSVSLDPSHIGAHVYLGKLYLLFKEWDLAKREFQQAIKLGDETGSGEYGVALGELGESHDSAALPHLLTALQADPKDPERLYTLIATEFHLKQLDSARKHIAQFDRLYPDDPYLAFRLAKLLQENRMPSDAEGRYERAIALLREAGGNARPLDINLSDIYLQVARLHYDHHDYEGTFQYLDKIEAPGLEPKTQAELSHLRGAAFLALGKVREAEEQLREAAQTNPTSPDYYVHWAWAELLVGNIDAASCATELARRQWPNLSNVQTLRAILARERRPERARIQFFADWHLKGEGMVCCPCTTPCPCRSNAPPTDGHCENTGVFHITEGHYGSVSLDGFTFVGIAPSMGETSVPSSIYVDSSATDDQLIAFERIYQTFNPLRPILLSRVQRAKIALTYSPAEKTYEVHIPRVLEIKVQRRLDAEGHPLLQTAAIDYFSNILEYARNLTYKVWDEDGSLRWDYSNHQANYRTVDVDSRDYWKGRMLIQYVDGSGYFNHEQLALIKSLNLPTLANYPRPTK